MIKTKISALLFCNQIFICVLNSPHGNPDGKENKLQDSGGMYVIGNIDIAYILDKDVSDVSDCGR